MPLKTIYRKVSPYVASYDYVDTLRGNAYIIFYGGKANIQPSKDIYYDTNDDAEADIDDNDPWFAQTFTVGSSDIWVNKVELYLREETAAWTADLDIEGVDGSNEPDGTPLASAAGSALAAMGAVSVWKEFNFSQTIKLEAGVTYALVLKTSNMSAGAHGYWRMDESSPTYTGGNYLTSTDDGVNWTADTGKDFMFRVYSSSNPYILFPEAYDSDPVSEVIEGEIDIDSEVNRAMIIKGEAILNISYLCNGNDVMSSTVEIDKVRGTTETSIGTATAEDWDANATDEKRICFKVDLTKTTFAVGDYLRVKVTNSATSDIENFTIYYNGTDKDLKCWIPFKLDV